MGIPTPSNAGWPKIVHALLYFGCSITPWKSRPPQQAAATYPFSLRRNAKKGKQITIPGEHGSLASAMLTRK
jgi:hypothetical protein